MPSRKPSEIKISFSGYIKDSVSDIPLVISLFILTTLKRHPQASQRLQTVQASLLLKSDCRKL
jgi:hypothetical protein